MTRPPSPDEANAAAQRATERVEQLAASLEQAQQELEAAARAKEAADEHAAAIRAHFENCEATFRAGVDPLPAKKIATADGWAELGRAIRAAQRSLYAETADRPGVSDAERLQGKLFADRIVSTHQSSRILAWVLPLLTNDAT